MSRKTVQLIREGDLAADVSIDLNEGLADWGPTVGLEDIRKLDRVRNALRSGDIAGAAREATVFKLVPQLETIEPRTGAGFQEEQQSELKP